MRPLSLRPTPHRRGVTLVEMLVVVALLVLMMTILVQIFQSATGAVSAQTAYAEMDQNLRRIDSVIRRDLNGITARMTPPLDPKDNLGYFEYGENAMSDAQGEDSDDYLAFTAKAPEGQPFIGRIYVPPQFATLGVPPATTTVFIGGDQFVTFTSQYAEIIYFLRNGNLYRRVFLVAPERKGSLSAGTHRSTLTLNPGGGFYVQQVGSGIFLNVPPGTANATYVGWQAMNDISARPSPFSGSATPSAYAPIPNSLGDLTNRENRAFRTRFANDFVNNTTGSPPPDGVPDDLNANGVPDYYPTLYPAALNSANLVQPLVLDGGVVARPAASLDTMAFPYLFPGAYSVSMFSVTSSSTNLGPIHGLFPHGYVTGLTTTPPGPSDPAPGPGPWRPNHAPLEIGDNLTLPDPTLPPPNPLFQPQTWWGFPIWAETLSSRWTDPIKRVNDPPAAGYFSTSAAPGLSANDTAHAQAPGLSVTSPTALPPVNPPYYPTAQPFNDNPNNNNFNGNTATTTAFLLYQTPGGTGTFNPWPNSGFWQEDLIMTGVRSFDIKAYDNVAANYVDLGYMDLDNLNPGGTPTTAQYLTFGHEGRMPPLNTDGRFDNYGRNLGDLGSAPVVRMRRVFDTWSTDYTNAPSTAATAGVGPPFTAPIYPSYPPPYPVALRGIQIQIRVVDRTNTKIKTLTIRQDFADKL